MRGVSAIELAILLPLLLVVFAGAVDFGLMLYDKAVITNAAREAARAGIMLREPRLTKAQIETIATDYCYTRPVSGLRQPLTITLIGDGTCTAAATVPNPITSLQSDLTVTVSYTYRGPVASLMALVTGSPLALGTMGSTATMKYE
ncbi:MAG: pilus assembly protein [Burkholderiaceae bacterium]|nr:pilus assembly protein [Burkholderiaceae bacterium]